MDGYTTTTTIDKHNRITSAILGSVLVENIQIWWKIHSGRNLSQSRELYCTNSSLEFIGSLWLEKFLLRLCMQDVTIQEMQTFAR
jgi:hypothetical protein